MARTGSPNKYLPKTIRTVNLQKEDIPNKNADWSEIGRFALTFDAVKELGTEDIYSHQAMVMEFDEKSSLVELRTSLFLFQRFWNNRLEEISKEDLERIKQLIEIISQKL